MSSLPKVAVIGRQNVGKSTLLNRLHGRREAIAHPSAGVTRDRLEIAVEWRSRSFTLVDTGGYVRDASGVEALVTKQARRAATEADVILLVCDGVTGIQEEDEQLARDLRRVTRPVIVVANKVDSEKQELGAMDFSRLGLGEPLAVSALHGRGSGDLLDRIVELLPDVDLDEQIGAQPRFTLVGRPNVGKSSLFNRLVGDERSVVFEEAGTTRDAIDAVVDWETGPVRFVDTAGLRRESKTRGVEYFSLVQTMRAIDRADVSLLVVDASEGASQEDKRIASEIIDAGRAIAIAANKWDLVEEKDKLFKELTEVFSVFAHAPVLRTSALTAGGIKRIPATLLVLHERWGRRVTTSKINEVLERSQAERPAPRGVGRYRYATQVSSGPPTFVVFGGRAPDGAYRRFLEARIRRAFDLDGTPVRLKFRPKEKRTDR